MGCFAEVLIKTDGCFIVSDAKLDSGPDTYFFEYKKILTKENPFSNERSH